MLRHTLVLALVAAIPAGGCFHVQLDAPQHGAPLPERLVAYQRLRPSAEMQTVTITTNQYGTSVSSELDLVLAGGESVRHADDLLPVLDASSASARSAHASRDARGKKWLWALGGTAVSIVGLGVSMSGISETSVERPDAGRDRIWLGLGVTTGALLAGLIGSYYYAHVEHQQRAAAFANFGDGLRARLDLCVDRMQIVDCRATPLAAPGAVPTVAAPNTAAIH